MLREWLNLSMQLSRHSTIVSAKIFRLKRTPTWPVSWGVEPVCAPNVPTQHIEKLGNTPQWTKRTKRIYRSRHCTIHVMWRSRSHMYRKRHVPKWMFLCTEVYLTKIMYRSSMYRNSHVPKTPYTAWAIDAINASPKWHIVSGGALKSTHSLTFLFR